MAGIVPTPFTTLPAPLPPGASAPPVPAGGDDLVWPTSGADTGGAGDQWKQPVRCAATGALTIASGLLTGAAVDGVTLAAGDRVLLTGQSAPAENGIYTAGPTPARSPDMDQDDEVLGALVYVIAGTASGGTVWRCTNTTAPVLGTTALAFAQSGSSPLTTKGDLFGHSTVDARIPVGTDAYVLTADSTQALGVKWAASASGFADPTTTKGDLIVHGTSTTRLGVGADTQVLTADSTQALGVKWAVPPGGGSGGTPAENAAALVTAYNLFR